MAIVKFKVTGSETRQRYYSRIIEVDDKIYPTLDDQSDFIREELWDECRFFDYSDWKSKGIEPIDYFEIDEFVKL